MKKNVASQVVGVQMITAADGTAFTSATTVVVTVDGGTQSASGGTGPTHEGNGFFTYLPTQAETNGDHIGFTFTGTGAIPATVQIYTTFPQTGDNFAIVNGAAGLVAINTDVEAILADTGTDGVVIAAAQTVATATAVTTVNGIATDAIDAASIAADAGTEIAAAVWGKAIAEPTAAFTWAGNIQDIIEWLGILSRNQLEQTTTTMTVRADDTTTAVSASTTSDAAGTFTRGEFT